MTLRASHRTLHVHSWLIFASDSSGTSKCGKISWKQNRHAQCDEMKVQWRSFDSNSTCTNVTLAELKCSHVLKIFNIIGSRQTVTSSLFAPPEAFCSITLSHSFVFLSTVWAIIFSTKLLAFAPSLFKSISYNKFIPIAKLKFNPKFRAVQQYNLFDSRFPSSNFSLLLAKFESFLWNFFKRKRKRRIPKNSLLEIKTHRESFEVWVFFF